MVGGLAANIKDKRQVVRKTVDLGVVFRPFGGLMGAPWVTAWGRGRLGRGLGPRIPWMDCLPIFGCYNLTLTA